MGNSIAWALTGIPIPQASKSRQGSPVPALSRKTRQADQRRNRDQAPGLTHRPKTSPSGQHRNQTQDRVPGHGQRKGRPDRSSQPGQSRARIQAPLLAASQMGHNQTKIQALGLVLEASRMGRSRAQIQALVQVLVDSRTGHSRAQTQAPVQVLADSRTGHSQTRIQALGLALAASRTRIQVLGQVLATSRARIQALVPDHSRRPSRSHRTLQAQRVLNHPREPARTQAARNHEGTDLEVRPVI